MESQLTTTKYSCLFAQLFHLQHQSLLTTSSQLPPALASWAVSLLHPHPQLFIPYFNSSSPAESFSVSLLAISFSLPLCDIIYDKSSENQDGNHKPILDGKGEVSNAKAANQGNQRQRLAGRQARKHCSPPQHDEGPSSVG